MFIRFNYDNSCRLYSFIHFWMLVDSLSECDGNTSYIQIQGKFRPAGTYIVKNLRIRNDQIRDVIFKIIFQRWTLSTSPTSGMLTKI